MLRLATSSPPLGTKSETKGRCCLLGKFVSLGTLVEQLLLFLVPALQNPRLLQIFPPTHSEARFADIARFAPKLLSVCQTRRTVATLALRWSNGRHVVTLETNTSHFFSLFRLLNAAETPKYADHLSTPNHLWLRSPYWWILTHAHRRTLSSPVKFRIVHVRKPCSVSVASQFNSLQSRHQVFSRGFKFASCFHLLVFFC